MVKIGFIIILLINVFSGLRAGNPCSAFNDIREQNTPIKAERKILWEKCLRMYNTSRVNTIADIYEYLTIVSRSPNGHVKVNNLILVDGRARDTAITSMNNTIPYVKIATASYVRKPAIAIVGGIFGCDWLTVAAAVNIVQELVLHYDKNRDVLSKTSWIIVPILNPDGYNETMTEGSRRNWIKNMNKINATLTNKDCFGVNLYKNFEYQWMHYNYNTSDCKDEYSSKPFSEVESKSLKDTLADNLKTVKIFVALIQSRYMKVNKRAYSYPFSFTKIKPLNHSAFDNILKRSAAAAKRLYHRHIDYGHILKYENESAGGPSDWIKAHFQVEVAFTCRISDFNDNRHILNTTEISKTNNETFAALQIMASLGTDFAEGRFNY